MKCRPTDAETRIITVISNYLYALLAMSLCLFLDLLLCSRSKNCRLSHVGLQTFLNPIDCPCMRRLIFSYFNFLIIFSSIILLSIFFSWTTMYSCLYSIRTRYTLPSSLLPFSTALFSSDVSNACFLISSKSCRPCTAFLLLLHVPITLHFSFCLSKKCLLSL